MKYTSNPFLDLFREILKGLTPEEIDPLKYLETDEKFKSDNLNYCKQGMHQMQQLGINSEFQCVYCGHMEHECNLMCGLYIKKCDTPKNINPKLPPE